MTTSRSTLQIVKYLHKEPSRGRSNSIVEMIGKGGAIESYIRDYNADIGAGAYGEVYRLKLETDPTKTILAKKEKPKKNGLYLEGINMRKEAENWLKIGGFAGYAGDENATQEPHFVIMPDLATKTTLRLKDVRYGSATDFLKLMWYVLDNIDEFHNNNQMVHYDMTENNILVDSVTRKIQFVDLGLARNIGEEIDPTVCHEKSHSGDSSGYFPPELNPTRSRQSSLDKTAKTSHDVYMVGRMLSRMITHYALDKSSTDENPKPIVFLPSIKAEFENIYNAMQTHASTRISLVDAICKMIILAPLNELLENQNSLLEKTEANQKMAKNLLAVLTEAREEIPLLAKHFDQKNQDAFLQLFGLKKCEQNNSASEIASPRVGLKC